MDQFSTPGSAPAAFASRPATFASHSAVSHSAAAPRTVSAEVAAGGGSAIGPGTKASYQDALLFIAPPLLSAAVLGALSVNLHRIPSAHPLTDASLLCAGAAALLITAWWFISFIYALFYARSLRVSSRNVDRAVLKVPAIFRPRFMRRIVLTLGGTALGVGAVLAPAQATVATPSNAGVNGTEGMPQTTISAVITTDSMGTATAEASPATVSDAEPASTTTDSITPEAASAPLTLSAEIPDIPLAPQPTEASGSLQDRSPFFSPPRAEAGTYSYTVQAGDTLWSIAAEQLGEGTDASTIYDYTLDIYEANKDALGQNAELLYEGQVLQIPEQPVH
ncbi:LysM peptidoglycan-binding domain-containing protein [Rothia sp. HMSC066G02]|uniref:LysM peptidoglycan-binding domain-containing protein n=1 Tax=Rothia TaxID=32207 RepID=UPI0008A2406D|nr:LysM peptidoglycan-binding domain-containing protein [Rothia sp. HMSC066G02]OFR28613.1 peptidoglycan-binding protein LysM [Rothia sp. HMSC066G02]